MGNPSDFALKARSRANQGSRLPNRLPRTVEISAQEGGIRVSVDALLTVREASRLRDGIDAAIEQVQTHNERTAP